MDRYKNKNTKAASSVGQPSFAGVKLIVTPEIVRYEVNDKGNFVGRTRPWSHAVKYNGVVYKPGDVFECDPKQAQRFLDLSCCQKAGQEKAFDPQGPDQPVVLSHGVQRREDVAGKIPSHKKGEWTDEDDG